MNERIKELAEQAKDYAAYYSMLSDFSEYGIFTEKFAELIIKECADYVRTNYDSWDAEPLAFNMERDFGLHGDYA